MPSCPPSCSHPRGAGGGSAARPTTRAAPGPDRWCQPHRHRRQELTTMPTLSFHQLSKQYGAVTVLDRFTATALPGRVTAFLGVNGSGKTTSMRIMLGLSEPTSGTATIDGVRYGDLPHPTRAAYNHLRLTARQAGVPANTADSLLERFGLAAAAGRRIGGFSLGMRQ